jgi:hypothetical protein
MDVPEPAFLERFPNWLLTWGFLLLLTIGSVIIRTRYISGQFWMDEAITTGIASHPLGQIPGLLRHDGSPPLFYVLLHFWIRAFGASETATHWLSLTFGLLTIPAAYWAGRSLISRRTGLYAATLFAFSAFLTQYADETRMYELMALLGLLATTAYVHAFVYRRRGYLIMFAVCQALMLYTHSWGLFFGAGAVAALIPVYRASDDRRGLLRDVVLAFGGAGVLFLPWLPNFIYQASHTGAPWAPPPRFGAPVLLSRDLIGGDRITIGLLIVLVLGLAPFFTKRYRNSRDGLVMWSLLLLPFATLLLAWLASHITPAFVSRYFAPILASILLLAAWGAARSGVVGLVAIILSIVFIAHVTSYAPQYKSDMRDVAGEMAPLMHPGDMVISGQPEQIPLGWYYLPNEAFQYVTPLGRVRDPTYFNWVFALDRLKKSNPQAVIPPLVASLRPGQRILFYRPLTEGAKNWKAGWTALVRRRSAQIAQILFSDPRLKEIAWAPHSYRTACCVANSAVLFQVIR